MGTRERLELLRASDLTLGTLLERLAAVHGTARLVQQSGGGRSFTYDGAADRVARLAAGIGERISRGDRVVVATPNGYDLLLVALAVTRAGGVAVPVNPQMSGDEIDHVLADSEATLVVRDGADVEGRRPPPAVDVDPHDVAVLFYTSGTTGRPKGVQLAHASLVGPGEARAGTLPLRRVIRECVTGMPVAHVAGFSLLLQMASLGVPVYLLARFRPDEALDAIERRRAAMFVGVPAMYRMMLEAGAERRDLRSVRVWASAADAMPADIARRFQRMGSAVTVPVLGRTLGVAAFVDGYGMVELGGGVSVRLYPPGVPLPAGGFVRTLRGHTLKVVDAGGLEVPRGEVGELVVKGPGVMRGYHGKDDETRDVVTPGGWLRTGDLGRVRRFGFVEFVGRQKDVIKHGGYSVFAVEVEGVLREHPAVAEAAVIGLADERMGEIPAAVVELAPGAVLEPEDLLEWASGRLSAYKVPRRVAFVDRLPRTGTDKVRKAELPRLFSG